jgi:hypothetical protein
LPVTGRTSLGGTGHGPHGPNVRSGHAPLVRGDAGDRRLADPGLSRRSWFARSVQRRRRRLGRYDRRVVGQFACRLASISSRASHRAHARCRGERSARPRPSRPGRRLRVAGSLSAT